MLILAITPWNGAGTPSGLACGIAQYAALLKAHLPADVELVPCPEGLDPAQAPCYGFDWIWLNYHRGLHSRWTPEVIREKGYQLHTQVAITFHDTYGESAPDQLTRDLYALSDAFVVHEPCVDLPRAVVIRQGVPDWPSGLRYEPLPWRIYGHRPVLGTCGFNFPWKGFDRLAEVTAEAGWGYLVLSNNATGADIARWFAVNPHTHVVPGYLPTAEIVDRLAGCDATAFPYQCANSGTSGAIRLGLAARKPVLAFPSCRQFRDLLYDNAFGIRWCYGGPGYTEWDALRDQLRGTPVQRVDPGVVYLAERDSWATQAARYADLFRSLAR